MKLINMSLLSKDEYEAYRSLISNAECWWWLNTPYSAYGDCVLIVNRFGEICDMPCYNGLGGVRPCCTFKLDSSDTLFWRKSESLIGTKIEYGNYELTILNVKDGMLFALSDEIIVRLCYDSSNTDWNRSSLKQWLNKEMDMLICVHEGEDFYPWL